MVQTNCWLFWQYDRLKRWENFEENKMIWKYILDIRPGPNVEKFQTIFCKFSKSAKIQEGNSKEAQNRKFYSEKFGKQSLK